MRAFLILIVFCFTHLLQAQDDSLMVKIAADTLSSEMQEGGISVEALEFYNRALDFASAGQTDSAVVFFTKSIESEPEFGKAYYNRSSAFIALNNYGSALLDIDRYFELVDTASAGYYSRATILLELGRMEDAIAAYERSIEKEDQVGKAHSQLAKIHLDREEYQESIDHFTAYLRYDPSDGMVLHDRGSAYQLTGDLKSAERDYRQAGLVDPNLATAFANLGAVLRKLERYEESVDAYDDAIKIDGDDAMFHNNRGYSNYLAGSYEDAVEDFKRSIEIDENYAYAHNNLASAYIKLEEYKKAIEAAGKAILLDPEYGFAYLNRGIAREMVRDIRGACEDWEKAESMNVKNAAQYRSGVCKYIQP